MKLSLLATILFVLTACGKSDNSSVAVVAPVGDSSGGTAVTSTSTSYAYASGVQGSPNYYFAKYQFKDGTCDTDLHNFSGPTVQVVMAQMCSGLRNEWMNHGCAQGARYSYYSQACR